MHVIGVDLSGPAAASTGVVVFGLEGRELSFVSMDCDGSDTAIRAIVERFIKRGPVIIGIDAPLSYEPGGGQRQRDADLRKCIVARGMKSGSVMAPTAPRMVYLTLRGIVLAGVLRTMVKPELVRIAEVHPGAALCLHGAQLDDVTRFSKNPGACGRLLAWLAGQGLTGIEMRAGCTSHFVAACGAALAAWKWHLDTSAWIARAEPPWHPYDFAC